jgi:beta-glucosidase/6-phospho-beta-glucosidase/beta-galactosidase
VPANPNNQSDIDAANHWNELQIATFANPIFLGEDYPEAFKMTVPDYVPLNATDLAYIKGTADFFGIDYYTVTVATPPSVGIAACAANTSNSLFPYCINQGKVTTTGWNVGYRGAGYVYTTPTYLRTFLNYLWNNYKTTIMVTELGFPVFGENVKLTVQDELLDNPRSEFYLSHMSEILKAIWEDHVDVSGVLAWSFADNWELGSYDAHFGMQYVDRTTQKRSYKKSFFDLVDFVAARTQNTTV